MILGQVLQQAYVTTDVDEACRVLSGKFGIEKFWRPNQQTMTLDDGREVILHNAHAWVGSIWLEIIQPIGGEDGLWRDWLAGRQGFAMKLHHLGIMVDSPQEMDAKMAEGEANGFKVALSLTVMGNMARYLDTVDALGHYLEYLYFPNPDHAKARHMPQALPGYPD